MANPETGNVDRIKLRVPIGECKTIKIPIGTAMVDDGGDHTAYAGQVLVHNDVLVVLANNVELDVSDNSAEVAVAIYEAADIGLVADSADAFLAGLLVYWNGTECTITAANLTCIGFCVEAKAAAAGTVYIHLCSAYLLATPDIAAGA